jgi:putrescine:ornithine antiporter
LGKVSKTDTPVLGLIIITVMQTLLSLMTISSSLSKQFNILVDLAVVTNIIPYLLSMASVNVIQRSAGVEEHKIKFTNFTAFLASLYSLYALYSCGAESMMYGSITVFIGFTLYGFISHRFDLEKKLN